MQSAGSRRGKDSSACHLRNRAAKIPKQRGKQGKSSKKRKKKENSVTMHNGPKRQGGVRLVGLRHFACQLQQDAG